MRSRTFPHGWATGATSRATRCRFGIPTTTTTMRRRTTTNRTRSRLSLENPTNRAKDLMSWWEAFVWGDLDRRCPARPADRGLLLLDSLLHGGHLVCARKPPREGLAALAARNKAHCQYTVKFWRQRVVIRHRPQ